MELVINRYIEIDKKLIRAIKEEENFDEILQEREIIMKELCSFKIEEAKKAYFEAGLDKLDEEVRYAFLNKIHDIKKEIQNNERLNNANNCYRSSMKERNLYSRFV